MNEVRCPVDRGVVVVGKLGPLAGEWQSLTMSSGRAACATYWCLPDGSFELVQFGTVGSNTLQNVNTPAVKPRDDQLS